MENEAETLGLANDLVEFLSKEESSDARGNVIEKAVKVEYLLNQFLAWKLGIQEPDSSMSLGNGSHALSFMAKVVLFNDLGLLDKNDRKKFELFGSIRNQFAHNIHAKSFVTAFSVEKVKDLKRFFSGRFDDNSEEELLSEQLFNLLFIDVKDALLNILKSLYERQIDSHTLKAKGTMYDTFFKRLLLHKAFQNFRPILYTIKEGVTNDYIEETKTKELFFQAF